MALSRVQSWFRGGSGKGAAKAVVHTLRFNGAIKAAQDGVNSRINFQRYEKQIDAAFKGKKGWWSAGKKPDVVALIVNSGGGSPVQSNLLYKHIRSKSEATGVPVVAFIEDAGASGGYFLACAADKIFVDEFSVVGSIGVITFMPFFPKALESLGVEMKTLTAGRHKDQGNPFSPPRNADLHAREGMLHDMHREFIKVVEGARGERLAEAAETATAHQGQEVGDLFDGRVFVGQRAVSVGLADDVRAFPSGILQEVGVQKEEDIDVVDFTPKRGFTWGNFSGGAQGMVDSVLGGIQERAEAAYADASLPAFSFPAQNPR